jgi:hypothetical protein
MVHISFNEFFRVRLDFLYLKAIFESPISNLGKACISKSVSAGCPPLSTHTTPGLAWGIVEHLNNPSILAKKGQEENMEPGFPMLTASDLYLFFIDSILFLHCDRVLCDLASELRVETCFATSSQSFPLSLDLMAYTLWSNKKSPLKYTSND